MMEVCFYNSFLVNFVSNDVVVVIVVAVVDGVALSTKLHFMRSF